MITLRVFWFFLRNVFVKPVTIRYPKEKPDLPGRYYGHPAVNDKTCIGCKLCAVICPNQCITMVKYHDTGNDRDDIRPRIHIGRCIYCGLCEEICPTGPKSIYMTHQYEVSTANKRELIIDPQQGVHK